MRVCRFADYVLKILEIIDVPDMLISNFILILVIFIFLKSIIIHLLILHSSKAVGSESAISYYLH